MVWGSEHAPDPPRWSPLTFSRRLPHPKQWAKTALRGKSQALEIRKV